MDDINPREFGRMQAQVDALWASSLDTAKVLKEMADSLHSMREQMAEAKGGWRLLMLLGGAASTFGGVVTYLLGEYAKR